MECLVGIFAFRRTSLINFYRCSFLWHQILIYKHGLDDNRKDALIEIFPAQQCPKNLDIKSNVQNVKYFCMYIILNYCNRGTRYEYYLSIFFHRQQSYDGGIDLQHK